MSADDPLLAEYDLERLLGSPAPDRGRIVIAALRRAAKRSILLEAADGLRFRADLGGRRAAYGRYAACRSPQEFLAFAQDHFPGAFSQVAEEVVPFLEFASVRSPQIVAEIGTQFGGTNFLLSQAIPTVTTMVGVDLVVRNRARLLAFRRPDQEIRLLNGSSNDAVTVARFDAALAGRRLDLLFIDGDHRWDGVVNDFLRYRAFVRPGGLVVFHDIVPDDRLRGWPPTSAYAGEVPILWQRLKQHYPSHEFVRDRTQEGFGIGVLEYDPVVEPPVSTFVL